MHARLLRPGARRITKLTATADQIRTEIARRLVRESASEKKCSDCVAPRPVPIERRGDGVNWSVENFPRLPEGCAAFMMRVLSGVMRDYDLAENGVAPTLGKTPPRARRVRRERPNFP